MPKRRPQKLLAGIAQRTRKEGNQRVPVLTNDGTAVYRVRVWNPTLQRQDEQMAVGLDAPVELLGQLNSAVWRPDGQRLNAFEYLKSRHATSSHTRRNETARDARWHRLQRNVRA